ncbi:MAG: hypothetical protein KDH17_06910 [Rhodocyclaceae bacterium]|nr:hypothetical protein [Rhodocyclaceae bacterium]
MKSLMKLLCGVLSMIGLGACDLFDIQAIKPGVTTAFEVRDRLGAPNTEWQNADGTVTWEYSRQPEGVSCYMITIGSDRVVATVEQVITEANMARIQPGWRREQVRRLLGRQRSEERFKDGAEVVWDWQIPAEHLEQTFFNVHFDAAGVVVKTSRSVKPLP